MHIARQSPSKAKHESDADYGIIRRYRTHETMKRKKRGNKNLQDIANAIAVFVILELKKSCYY